MKIDSFGENPSVKPGAEAKATTRVDRQRLRTRRLFLDADRTLIAAKEVAGLRIQEITESLSDLTSAIITNVDDTTDPAEVVALANLRVIRLAYDEPDFARLIVNIGHSEVLFGDPVHPPARTVERGIESGRFVVADIEVLLTVVSAARSR